VVPNLDNDMHNGTVQQADAWLKANLDAYIKWAPAHNSVFIVTWDEDDGSSDNHIATIFGGANVVASTYGETINHYTVLRTIEEMYALNHAGESANQSPILDIWVQPGVPTAPKITSSLSAAGVTGQNFSYRVTVTGTEPITITADTLPAGMSISGDTISGVP